MIINNNLQGIAGVYTNSGSVNKLAKAYRQEETVNDNIQISSQGQQFSEILKKLKSGSDVRMDKVAEYENMIASGAYQVSNRDLAEKILQYRY
ncbi:MAG: flagellar biosynthesis anti-sigma factor FlgM [Selenomonadaceae bacterium]|nr:flagellar biosynthesis anti-sigma factor FlgM [Selenomonadaceae bacterium]